MAARKTDVWNQMLALAVYTKDRRLYTCGTAFLVGRGLAISATHVLDQPFDQRMHDAQENDVAGFVAFQVIEHGPEPLAWRVKSVHRFPSLSEDNRRPLDVCLLPLEPYGDVVPAIEEYRRRFFEINVAPPQPGTRVTAYGFAESQLEQVHGASDEWKLRQAFRHIEGTVTEIHSPMRDPVCLPFPCFGVDAEFEPGMSGGPIFNERHQVCGVVSRGGLGVSWAVALWPVLGISLDDGRSALQLAQEGVIRARNHHCVELRYGNDHEFPEVLFDPNFELP